MNLAKDSENSAMAIGDHLVRSLAHAEIFEKPYPHWIAEDFLPAPTVDAIRALDISAPALNGISGKRELHNEERAYFDARARQASPVVSAVCDAFQSPQIARWLGQFFKADLEATYLRIEPAADIDGFWLQPHTDLGVKRLTILHYLSDDPRHGALGTDIYDAEKRPVKRTPFRANLAFAFRPGDNTFHGFEPRPIHGVRKTLIINYVTDDWREREQLAFPDVPVSPG